MENILQFEEESRLVPVSGERITPETAVMAGAACARAAAGGRILTAHSGENGAAALAAAFSAGAAAAGADCVSAEVCPATAAAYAVKKLKCAMGCYVHTELDASFKLFASDGLALFGDTEKTIEQELDGGKALPYSHYGSISDFIGAAELYAAKLGELLGGKLKGIYADVSSPSMAVMSCFEKAIGEKNDRSGGRIAFHISGDGSRISAYSDDTGYVFREKLIMICCRDLFESGSDAAVCGKPPRVLEKMAEEYGRRVISCGKNICRSEERQSDECACARRLASEQLFMHDGTALAVRILDILRRHGTSLREEAAGIPSFAGISRYIPVDKPSELLKRLCTPDGVLSDNGSERVVIRPVRTGRGIMLDVESFAMEAARELCDRYMDIIKNKLSDQ